MSDTEEIYSPYRKIEEFIDSKKLKNLTISQDFLVFKNSELLFQNIDFTSVNEINFLNKEIKIIKYPKLEKNCNNFEISITITIKSIYDDAIPNEKDSDEITDIESIKELKFINCILNTMRIGDCSLLTKITLEKTTINGGFSFNNNVKIDKFICVNSIFEKKVEIKESKIQNIDLSNTKFKDLADFYKTEFYDTNFHKTTFEDISVFTEATFHEIVDFEYTTFKELALFRKTKFKKTVNFEDSIFKVEANFLDISASMANRETARIIKNSFEKQSNIIEANKFYALEMKEREKELGKDIKNGKNFFEWLIFKAHEISSNHSQDWVLALLWIIAIGLLYTTFSFCSLSTCLNSINTSLMMISISLASIYNLHFYGESKYKRYTKYIYLLLLFINYIALTKDVTLSCLASRISPFSALSNNDPIALGLLFKVTIAYLIYQFVVSVRQNTRRK